MTIPFEKMAAIERPHPRLFRLYLIRSFLSGPGVVFVLPLLYFRYQTLRYRFDDEGVHMKWGILFRREINLTYRRIQDIHVRSGIIQRWLGLADVLVQTASGSSAAEMTIEGLLEYEDVRQFLYSKMRGNESTTDSGAAAEGDDQVVSLLGEIRDELASTRKALESRPTE